MTAYAKRCARCGVNAIPPCPVCRTAATPEDRFRQQVQQTGGKPCRCSDVVALIDRYGADARNRIDQLAEHLSKRSHLSVNAARDAIEKYIDEKFNLSRRA